MKVTVDIECTPEEARRFMGLPDLTPIHATYIERTQKLIEQGITPDAVRTMMESWGPMSEAGMLMWRQMLQHMSGAKA